MNAPVASAKSSVGISQVEARDAGIVLDPQRVLANRFLNFISIFVPLIGTVFAIAIGITHGFSPLAWTLFAILFAATVLGVAIGLHRFFTHRSFKAQRWLEIVLAILGTAAMQGPIDRWVADHRRHHRFTDQPLDPHSPHYDLSGKLPMLRGLAHAHFFWMLTGLVSDERRYAADIRPDTAPGWSSRHYWLIAGSVALLPGVIGGLANGLPEAVACFLLAGCARVSLLHQFTWAVNSIGHVFGGKQEDARDESRDNVVLALLLAGEGLHSYHHKNPTAAVLAPTWMDTSGALLRLMERAGWIWDVQVGPKILPRQTGAGCHPEYQG